MRRDGPFRWLALKDRLPVPSSRGRLNSRRSIAKKLATSFHDDTDPLRSPRARARPRGVVLHFLTASASLVGSRHHRFTLLRLALENRLHLICPSRQNRSLARMPCLSSAWRISPAISHSSLQVVCSRDRLTAVATDSPFSQQTHRSGDRLTVSQTAQPWIAVDCFQRQTSNGSHVLVYAGCTALRSKQSSPRL